MIEKEYGKLIRYIEEMISNGIQLFQDGRVLDWNETQIPIIIAEIHKKRKRVPLPKLNAGDQLRNKVSKQDMWVIIDDGKTVSLGTATNIITYPLKKILDDFIIVKRFRAK